MSLPSSMKDDVLTYIGTCQQNIVEMLKRQDESSQLQTDSWDSLDKANMTKDRSWGGSGTSCVLSGQLIEQAGANISHVKGEAMPASATAHRPELAGASFEAMGISCVIHSSNPYVPTAHMNVRFFQANPEQGEPIWWFGGGFDLTPFYPNEKDCVFWHEQAKAACDPFGPEWYPKFKQWADEYFYLKHRKECRGVGGIFFDDFNALSPEESFAFMRSVGDHFVSAYEPILERNKHRSYTDEQRAFQCYRRGRYVEFNLVYDRGTLFGLQNGGRTESILMSLPPEVNWRYNWSPDEGSQEAEIYTLVRSPKDWV